MSHGIQNSRNSGVIQARIGSLISLTRLTFFKQAVLLLALLIDLAPAAAQSKAPVHALRTPADVIIAQEKAALAFAFNGEVSKFDKMIEPEFTDVSLKIWHREDILSFIARFHQAGCRMSYSKIVDPKLTFLSPTIATIVYHSVEAGACGTRNLKAEGDVSTVWVLRDGNWQMHLRTKNAELQSN
jgi:hypothetical protein